MDHHPLLASVLVPCYNGAATIHACLNALTNQSFDQEFEIILVDSSEDETPEIVRTEYPRVRLIHLPQKTLPGPARNIGVTHARGDVVAFTDADCILTADWLKGMVEAHKADPTLAGVAGSVMATPSASLGTAIRILSS